MEQGASSFGDCRLDRVNRFIHDRLVSHGPDGLLVCRLGGHRAGEIRLGRFLRKGKVSEDRIIAPVVATSLRVGGVHVLLIQDTTSFRDDGRGTSLVVPTTLSSLHGETAIPPSSGPGWKRQDHPPPVLLAMDVKLQQDRPNYTTFI